MRTLMSLSFIGLLLSACADDGGDGGGGGGGGSTGAPTAPTALSAAKLGSGAHLTWTDASSNEDNFMVMRKTSGGAYEDVAMVPFDTVQYHDEPLAAGTTYVYVIMAMNEIGSSSSNEVTFTP